MGASIISVDNVLMNVIEENSLRTMEPIKIFYCYAPQDKILRDQFETHLMALKRLGQITLRLNREIAAGTDWTKTQSQRFREADLILLLVSPSFIASDYHYGIEMHNALEKHGAGNVSLIPILLRPIAFLKETPFGKLQVLPKNGKAISEQRNRDAAFVDIVKEIGEVVAKLFAQKQELLTRKAGEGIFPKFTRVIGPLCITCGARNPPGVMNCENCGDLLLTNAAQVPQKVQAPYFTEDQLTNTRPLLNVVEPNLINKSEYPVPPTNRPKRSKIVETVNASSIIRNQFSEGENESRYQEDTQNQRQLFTALDIGTAYAKAIIFEAHEDMIEVLGVGWHEQSHAQMVDGLIVDLVGVIANCNEALLKAEKSAGGVIAPQALFGSAGELVKSSSVTISEERVKPITQITPEELDALIMSAQQILLKNAREHIAVETGYHNIDIRLVHSKVFWVMIDGHLVTNPIGFRGRHFSLTLFSVFAPLTYLGALETVAQGLDLTLVSIISEPYALARSLSANADSEALFIDIGEGTTDIALLRGGVIEEVSTFPLGGREFTKRISALKSISMEDAERLKIEYSNGKVKESDYEEIRTILAADCQTWIDSIVLLIEELSKGKLLPPVIYMVGGGSALPDIYERLKNFHWTERLPFSCQPIIRIVQPDMVSSVNDPKKLLVSAQDVPLIALACEAIELLKENNIIERSLYRVMNNMHI